MGWVQWLALAGGLAAAVAFVAGRRDIARSAAAGVYVEVTLFQLGATPSDTPLFTRYKIVNDGRLPALAVSVSAWGWGRRRFWWGIRRQRNWMTGHRIIGHVYHSVIPNSSTEEDDLPGLLDEGPPAERPPVMLVFRDGFGRRWVRWPDGKLTRLAPSVFQLERMWARRRRRGRRP
jgi:hypothetical protein